MSYERLTRTACLLCCCKLEISLIESGAIFYNFVCYNLKANLPKCCLMHASQGK